ncbi:TetR/AcrR family transcriptional regulator, partial [Candidatus Saccharibacteria bacterium]|nr:TetR/AcrR family transcriptional regulator [Candidatus Saccharibacteria bacterium]
MNKSEETKELIETTFLNLLAARPLNEISVNDVTEKCGLNRNTLYDHFKNIP